MKIIPYFLAPVIVSASCTVEEKPNVIVFLADDLGWVDLSCYGSDFYQTPNIDRLAAEGVKFTDAYSACTVSSPTRAGILTGKYPARLHLTNFIPGHDRPFARYLPPADWVKYLDPFKYTLARALGDEGYSTVHIGKWHLGAEEKYWPEYHGFDLNIGAGALSQSKNGRYFSPYGNSRLSDGPDGEYLTERLASEAVSFILSRDKKDKPFFLNFWFFTPHTPLQASEEKIEKYQSLADTAKRQHNPVYAAMVEHLDDAVGRVMEALKTAGVDNSTIVIFASDNGGLISDSNNPHVTSNYPLRSGKGDMFEGGVRVPFIVRWNKKIKAGVVNDTPVITNDIFPTILGLTKSRVEEVEHTEMDGIDLTGLLLHEKPLDRESLFWHFPHYHPGGAKPHSAIRKGKWKLIEIFGSEEPLLYDLDNDIGEQENLTGDLPDKAKELLADLNNWRTLIGAQYPELNPDYNPEFQDEFLPPRLRGRSLHEFMEWLMQEKK